MSREKACGSDQTYPEVKDLKGEGEHHVEAFSQQREFPRLDELHGDGHQRLGKIYLDCCYTFVIVHVEVK